MELAEKLWDKGTIEEISDYQKLIEAVNKADEEYGEEEYEEAQQDYLSAKERSRYADHISDKCANDWLGACNEECKSRRFNFFK